MKRLGLQFHLNHTVFIYRYLFPTSQQTHCASITNTSRLILSGVKLLLVVRIILNTRCTQLPVPSSYCKWWNITTTGLQMVKALSWRNFVTWICLNYHSNIVPNLQKTPWISITNNNNSMLWLRVIYSENHTEHTNALLQIQSLVGGVYNNTFQEFKQVRQHTYNVFTLTTAAVEKQ